MFSQAQLSQASQMAVAATGPADLLKNHRNFYTNVVSCIEKSIEAATDLAEIDAEAPEIEEIHDAIKNYIDNLAKLEIYEAIVNEVKAMSSRGQAPPNGTWESFINNKVDTEMANYDAKTDKEKYYTNNFYKTFREHIWEACHDEPMPPLGGDDEDDDLVIVGTQNELRDPLTLAPLEDPYTSKTCGHSVSKSTLEHLFKDKVQIECPIAGCPYLMLISDYVADKKLARKIRRLQEREQSEDDTEMDED